MNVSYNTLRIAQIMQEFENYLTGENAKGNTKKNFRNEFTSL